MQWGDPMARNITKATLTPFLADPKKANGTSVIVAPGGGFMWLSMKNEGWEAYRQQLLSIYPQRTPEENFQHAARQAYIGLGSALITAAAEGVDSTPMEGFEPENVDAILNLSALGQRSVLLLPLGYRASEGDWLVNLAKVRRSTEDFVIRR